MSDSNKKPDGADIFGGVDFNSPDYYMRETLKKNMWQFSSAKNYNDCVTLNNLLLDEKGALRRWNDFKHEAIYTYKIVDFDNQTLQKEYNTIVGTAQMVRIWLEIQRDKAIFPFVQFLVVNDQITSETCRPLHKLIFEVDDPVLAHYFPPNHFNCRTTVIKLRSGVPSKKYVLPEISNEFINLVPNLAKKLYPNGI